MGLILLGTESLLLGPRMSDAQGVLLRGRTSASFCRLGLPLPLSRPYCQRPGLLRPDLCTGLLACVLLPFSNTCALFLSDIWLLASMLVYWWYLGEGHSALPETGSVRTGALPLGVEAHHMLGGSW